jgi:hypothetical protein
MFINVVTLSLINLSTAFISRNPQLRNKCANEVTLSKTRTWLKSRASSTPPRTYRYRQAVAHSKRIGSDDSIDPFEFFSFEEIEKLEQDRRDQDKRQLRSFRPQIVECSQYRWWQDDEWIEVDVPLPRASSKRDVRLAISSGTFQLNVKATRELGEIEGVFVGEVVPESVSYDLLNNGFNLRIKMKKLVGEGTNELWLNDFLVGETHAPTFRYSWEKKVGDERRYRWKQSLETVVLEVVVPRSTNAGDVKVGFSPDARGWQLTLPLAAGGDFQPVGGRFWDAVRMEDSTWLLLSDDGEDRALAIEATFVKRSPFMWPCLFRGEDLAQRL